MTREKLFDSLCLMSVILENTVDNGLKLIREDDTISESTKEDIKKSVKTLLFHSLELFDCVRRDAPHLDFVNEGEERYFALRKKAKTLLDDLEQ